MTHVFHASRLLGWRLVSFLFLLFQAVFESIAVAGDVEDVDVVRETIEQCACQPFILCENLWPLCKRQVGRDDQAGLNVGAGSPAQNCECRNLR